MSNLFLSMFLWIKALHVIAVISWMAGMLYLPRLFVYHAERAENGSELDATFQIMERKLMKMIINPAMIVAWICGIAMLAMGAFDWSSGWAWIKIISVIALSGMHGWLETRRKEFEKGLNSRSGRTYRLMNEVPTVLMIVIVVMIIVRPF